MSSSYPGALDSFSTGHADGVSEIIHAATINDLADAVNKIEAELGIHAGDGISRTVTLVVAASNAPTPVKNAADYVCDGTADDVEINAAIAAAPTGRILLSEGTFTVAAPILIKSTAGSHDRTVLEGSGFNTIITPAAGFSAGANPSAVVAFEGDGTQPIGYAALRNVFINGNNVGSYTAPIDGVFFRGYDGRIENVYVYRCSGNGFHYNGYAGWSTFDTMTRHCVSSENWLDGYCCDSQRAEDMHFVDCIAKYNGDGSTNTGIDTVNIDTTTKSAGWRCLSASEQITGCHAYSNNTAGFYVAAARTKFANCKIEHNRHGIFLAAGGSFCNIVGNNFKGGKGTAVSDHIHCEGASGNGFSTVIGNEFDHTDDSGAAQAQSAINLTSGQTQNMVIVGNKFDSSGWGSGPIINNGGTSSFGQLITNNIGYVTENQGFFTTSAATSYTFAHGCSYTPPKAEVTLTPLGSYGAVQYWVSAIDATNITVTFSAAPTSGVNFGWTVGRRGMR